MPNQALSTSVARDSAAFAALREDWAIAVGRSGGVRFYQDFDWNWTWWSKAGVAAAGLLVPHIAVVRDAAGPVAIAPMMLRRDRRLSTLDWMAAEATDYADVIVAADADRPAVAAALTDAIGSSGAALADLRQIRPDSMMARLMEGSLRSDPREGRAIFVATGGLNEENFQKQLNAELRKTMRRRARRLSEQVKWTFVVSEDPALRRAALRFCLAHKVGQLAHDAASLAAHETLFAPFAETIFARQQVGSGRPITSAIMAGDRFLSAHVGFIDAERMYYYLTAHDPEFERSSPGTLLAIETIKHCCRVSLPVFDFLRGDYAFKWAISKTSVPLLAHRQGLTWAGRAYLPLEHWARAARSKLGKRKARKTEGGAA